MGLPDEFKEKMKSLLKNDEYDGLIDALEAAPAQSSGIRANLLKTRAELMPGLLGSELEGVPWCDGGFYCPVGFRPGKNPLYHAGLYYIQEPSAMVAAAVADIEPGQRVLDLCAAPGGKSTHAAGMLRGRGMLVANDISASRVRALVKNIELAGVTNAVVLNESPDKLARVFAGYFDRIILDAPCSGEGMFRKDPDAIKSWSRFKSQKCADIQRALLKHAAAMLAGDGMLIYSTCTFAPEENEIMINEFLSANSDFAIAPIDRHALGISCGLPVCGVGEEVYNSCGRIWPHKQRGEGHFVARLRRRGCPQGSIAPKREYPARSIPDFSYFLEFSERNLSFMPSGDFVRNGDSLYIRPGDMPEPTGLRVARSGLFLGEFKTKRFEPSQALAMCLKREDARRVIDFPHASPEILRYLKGESFETDAPDGWSLVCMSGLSAGWCKVQSGRIKNKYLRGWVMD